MPSALVLEFHALVARCSPEELREALTHPTTREKLEPALAAAKSATNAQAQPISGFLPLLENLEGGAPRSSPDTSTRSAHFVTGPVSSLSYLCLQYCDGVGPYRHDRQLRFQSRNSIDQRFHLIFVFTHLCRTRSLKVRYQKNYACQR